MSGVEIFAYRELNRNTANMEFYICLIILITNLPFGDFSIWPSDPGCNKVFDDEQCLFRFYCFDSLMWDSNLHNLNYLQRYEYSYYEEFVTNCDNDRDTIDFMIYYKGRCDIAYYSQPEVLIECNYDDELNDCSKTNKIVFFDMSNQNCLLTPNLAKMSQLSDLNLSHNSFSEAKLYNEAHLNSLTKIDYSYNKIYRIDVSGEYKLENITWLNFSHNELEFLPDSIFDVYSRLNNIDLSFNRLEKLELMTFDGIKDLKFLNLSHNNITDINSSLHRFKKLKTLNLSFNNLKTINTQDFRYLINLETLDISFNSIVRIEKTSFMEMSLLRFLNLTHNFLELLDKDMFANNNALAAVDISSNSLNSLPKDLFRNKSMYCFSIIGNKLEGVVSKGTFDGLNLVNDLDISYQLLTSIDDFAFFGMEKLTMLILKSNKINFLSKMSFKLIFKLIHLDLSYNKISNIDFEKDDLHNLRYLSLENNLIKQIDNADFVNLKALNFLYLARNNISKLKPKIFKSLQNLRYFEICNNPLSGGIQEDTFYGFNFLSILDISGTNLMEIANHSFNGMIQLKAINISHSSVNMLQYDAFAKTVQIETIDLSYNTLKIFMLNPLTLLKLTELLLNNNMLTVISDTSFKGLKSLSTIDLSYNNISSINGDAFKDQTNLKYLELSFNHKMYFNDSIVKCNPVLKTLLLSGLNQEVFFSGKLHIPIVSLHLEAGRIKNISAINLKSLSQAENIDLKYNNITTLNIGELSGVKFLRTLDLSYNKIMYIQPGVFEHNLFLLHLNISHNKLKELNYGIFKGLMNLKILDVSFNDLYDLKNERFYELRNLDELIVDHNNIDSFDAKDFISLKLLSIGGNPLPCEILINLNKNHLPFRLSAINMVNHEENVDGITCNKNEKISSPTSNLNYTKFSENNQVLFEIRDELVRIANDNKLLRNSASATELSEQMFKQNNEHLIQLTNFSALMVKEVNNSNMLLQKLINLNTYKKTTTAIPLTKDNATSENILPYINKIKQELEELMSSEKNSLMEDINLKLSAIYSRIENSKSSTVTSTYLPASQESLKKIPNNNNHVQSKSVFTEVCVGFILFILVGNMLYAFYKSKLFKRPRRSSSTRELESQNL